MPKTSMAGSIFPDLEREQTSTAHLPHTRSKLKQESSDKIRKTEKSDKIES